MEILFSDFESFLLYSGVILSSFIMSIVYCKCRLKTFATKILFSILVVFPLVFLFAFRDKSVGTDFHFYYDLSVRFLANLYTLSDLPYMHGERSFNFMLFVLSKMSFGSVNFMFALLGFLIFLPAFWGITSLNNYVNAPVAWLFYLSVFYFLSYNITRQALSVSIVSISFKYLFERKIWKCFVIGLFACLFHYSSIVYLLVFSLIFCFNIKTVASEVVLYIVVLLFLFVFFTAISSLLGYGGYLNNQNDISYFLQSCIILSPFYYYARFVEPNKKLQLSFLHFIPLCILISTVSMVSDVAIRLFISLQFLPVIVGSRIVSKRYLRLCFYVFLYFLGYQYLYIYVLHGSCEVFPYIFSLDNGF